MKIQKIMGLAGLLLLPAAALAQSSVTLYGIVDVGVASHNLGAGNTTLMQGASYPSRIGFRGTEDLGGGHAATFQLEGDINVDDGSGGAGGLNFTRVSTVGLQTPYGHFQLGRNYSPGFLGALNHDYSGYGYYNSLLVFTGTGGITTRYSNGIFWTSPVWSGVTVRAAVALGERETAPQSVGNAWGLSAVWKQGALGVDGYYQVEKLGQPAANPTVAADRTQSGLGAQYSFGPVRVMGGWGQHKTERVFGKTTGYNAGVVVKAGPSGEVMAHVIKVKADVATGTDPSALAWGLTYRHFLSKRTTLYVTTGQTRNNATGNFPLFSTRPHNPSSVGADPRGFAVGIQHNF